MKQLYLILFWLIITIQTLSAASVNTNKTSYFEGETIIVSFTGSSTTKDWIGIYTPPASPGSGISTDWVYCNSGIRTAGTVIKQSGNVSFTTSLAPGSYIIYLCENDGYSIMAQVSLTVTATPLPIAAFSVSKNIIKPSETVTFTDLSTNNPISWSWTFEGGTPATSNLQNPSVTYNSEGKFNVTLVASNQVGSSTPLIKSKFINVTSTPPNEVELKVMQFNVWHEGASVPDGFNHIVDIINTVNPDIVSFSEVRNYNGDWTTKLISALEGFGIKYHRGYSSGDVSIISKYPIVSTSDNLAKALTVFEVDLNGTPIVVAAAHLDYTHYACYLPRGYSCGGQTPYTSWDRISTGPVTDVSVINAQNLASQRDEQIASFLNFIKDETRPVILMGDFNEPSHLDWTENQASLFDHNGVVFQWSTTLTLSSNGFTDAYRKVYPNEVTNPGITWPAVATGVESTSWTPLSDERERIDYIFYKGADVYATNAAIVGPRASYVRNAISLDNNGSDIFLADQLPWPSDHKAVTASIRIPLNIQLEPPYIVGNKSTYSTNEAITCSFDGSESANDWIGIFPKNAPLISGNYLDWRYSSGTQTASSVVISKGQVTFEQGIADAGNYTVYLLSNDGFNSIASFNFTVVSTVPPTASFSANQTSIFPGQTLQFIDQSANNPTSWSWLFPGGTPSSSTEQNPKVAYSQVGTYDVSLVSSNSFGNSDMLTIPSYIEVSNTPVNKALKFDGIDDQLFTGIDLLNTWTVQAWIKGDGSWSEGSEAIFCNGWMNLPNWEQYPLVLKGGKPSTSNVTAPNALNQEWNHIAVTFNGVNEKIYVNGVLSATGEISKGGPCSPNFIGSYDSDSQGSQYFGGLLDEVAIFDEAISESTIAEWYKKSITPSHPNYTHLKLYYPFNDEATFATDEKNNFNGTLKRQYSSTSTPGGPVYVASQNNILDLPNEDMSYVSSTVLPAKFDGFQGDEMQIMKLKINVTGYQTPLSLNEITLDLSSCTSLSDISTVKLYYLGKFVEETYKTEIFGNGVSPSSSLTFSGNQALLPGTNYFMVTYKLANSAVVGNKIDISCVSFKLNEKLYTPTVKTSVNYPKGVEVIAPETDPLTLKVLQANVWHGLKGLGQKEGVKRMLGIIRASKADVITLQETYGVGPTLRDSLGWNYYEPASGSNLSILSRYPIVDTYPARNNAFYCIGVKINIPQANTNVNVFNWWLPYWGEDYTLLQWSPTSTAQEWITGDNNTAVPVLQNNLSKDVNHYVTDNTPTIIAGDFNSASHLDFTQNAAAAGRHNGWVVDLPVSHKMLDAGYTDSFREVNPNEVTHTGGTWAAIYSLCHDFRIDFIYYKAPQGNISCVQSRTYDENTDIGTQWPSDHAAVLSTFKLTPGPTSVHEAKHAEWKVYPNPCKDNLTISLDEQEGKRITVQVFDTIGREVFTKHLPSFQQKESINLSDKNPGIYVVRIHNLDTGSVAYRKIYKI
jgi:PKD repeat protein